MTYDDDEENPPVGFEQDPESDDIGDGYWTYADGSRKYASGDAGDAKKLMKAAPPPPDDTKGLGSQGPYGGNSPPEQGRPGTGEFAGTWTGADGNTYDRNGLLATPGKAGTAPGSAPVSPDEEFLNSTTGAEEEDAAPTPEASEQPKPLSPQPLQAPRMPGAGGPARYTDSTGSSASQSASQSNQTSTSRTQSGQDKGEFEQQQADIDRGYEAQKGAVDEGAQGVANALQQRRAAVMQMGADKEAATQAALASDNARKAQVTQKIVEVGARPTDHNKIWKDKGALGTTLGLLGVALRSLTATKFGGPNTALQSIQEQKRQNLESQMQDRDSELRGLEKELGSIEAAAPMLEARMNDALSKRIDAMMIDEKSATVLANAKTMKAQLDTESAAKKAEAAKAYYGTLATQQAQSSQLSQQQGIEQSRQRLSGAGVGDEGPKGKSRDQVYDDLLERDKKMEERGIPKEERAKMWSEYGFDAPSGESAPAATNREQREKVERDEANLSEDQAKAESGMVLIGEFGANAELKRDPKTGKWLEPGGISGSVVPGWTEGAGELVGQSTPVKDSRVMAQQAVGRLLSGGVIGPKEAEEFSAFFGDGKATRNQIASKLNALESLANSRRKAVRRDAPRSAPSSWKSKPEATP